MHPGLCSQGRRRRSGKAVSPEAAAILGPHNPGPCCQGPREVWREETLPDRNWDKLEVVASCLPVTWLLPTPEPVGTGVEPSTQHRSRHPSQPSSVFPHFSTGCGDPEALIRPGNDLLWVTGRTGAHPSLFSGSQFSVFLNGNRTPL